MPATNRAWVLIAGLLFLAHHPGQPVGTDGLAVTQKDIFAVNYPAYTWGGYVWRGAQHGWNYNIDAIELNGW